jgi:hypothetical protein
LAAVRCLNRPDAGAGGVRCKLVPMLLNGGCGYEDFRLFAVYA